MKTVLITGASSGFGKNLTQEFLQKGYKVIATARQLSERREIFAAEREQFGDRLQELDLDVTKDDEISRVTAYFTDKNLDILVNNAGYAVFGPVETCSAEQIRKQFDVNFFGLVFLTKSLLPALRKSRGQIFNFSSVMGLVGFPLSSFYCASKFAVEGFSESLSHELRPFGVRVVLIEPGGYRTNFNESAVWGMSADEKSSVYATQVKNYGILRGKLASRPNFQDPRDLARSLVQIAGGSSRKISYAFGKDALFTNILRRSLPRSVFHRLAGNAFDRMIHKESP